MKKHDWRGGGAVQCCGNAGCTWVRLPRGVDGDPRIHYAKGRGEKPILKPYPCQGMRATDEAK